MSMNQSQQKIGCIFTRVKLPTSTNLDSNDATYYGFSAAKGEKNVQGFGSSYVLTEVETNYEGKIKGGFRVLGIGIKVVPDALDSVHNAKDAFEVLTKSCVMFQVDGSNAIPLGRPYEWPSGYSIGRLDFKNASTTSNADATILSADAGVQHELAEPIDLPDGATPQVWLKVNTGDPPALSAAGQFLDIRIFGIPA